MSRDASIACLKSLLTDHPGDVALKFPDGATLLIHSTILAMMSEPLRGALETCDMTTHGPIPVGSVP